MEGLKILETSYNNLRKFQKSIIDDSFSNASQLSIILDNYDMETQNGIKDAIATILNVYKDELDINITKILSGDIITIKIPNIDGFRDDLVDSLRCYIEKRAPSLFASISNTAASGGIYGV